MTKIPWFMGGCRERKDPRLFTILYLLQVGPAGYTKCIRQVKGHLDFDTFISIHFSEISVLEDNKALENILSEFQMPTMQYGTLRVAGFGELIQDPLTSTGLNNNLCLLKFSTQRKIYE